jgi:hypothetical protein
VVKTILMPVNLYPHYPRLYDIQTQIYKTLHQIHWLDLSIVSAYLIGNLVFYDLLIYKQWINFLLLLLQQFSE